MASEEMRWTWINEDARMPWGLDVERMEAREEGPLSP